MRKMLTILCITFLAITAFIPGTVVANSVSEPILDIDDGVKIPVTFDGKYMKPGEFNKLHKEYKEKGIDLYFVIGFDGEFYCFSSLELWRDMAKGDPNYPPLSEQSYQAHKNPGSKDVNDSTYSIFWEDPWFDGDSMSLGWSLSRGSLSAYGMNDKITSAEITSHSTTYGCIVYEYEYYDYGHDFPWGYDCFVNNEDIPEFNGMDEKTSSIKHVQN